MAPMHLSSQQEAFSLAYVRAVAATAGYRVQGGPQPDDDSVDMTISSRGAGGTIASPKVDIQLKCQLGPPAVGNTFTYDLNVKNHEDLRHEHLQVPRILVVVVVPRQVANWLDQDDERLLMRHCGWWVSLRGEQPSENRSSVRVTIPRSQRFDVTGLDDMMGRLAQGELP